MSQGRTEISDVLSTLYRRGDLTRDQARDAFFQLGQGQLSEVQITALLVALRVKGEHPEEIAGAAEALRGCARPFPRPEALLCADSCGTGGDGSHTINVSTAVALVAAEAGLPVAKHGNRSVSSRCGSADVLEELGLTLSVPADVANACLQTERVCFLFAPDYHPGLRHAMQVRRALSARTLFNLLGPLLNPAAPRWQIVGVYDPALLDTVAAALSMLGCEAALAVHGGGLDELAIHDVSQAVLATGGGKTRLSIVPEEVLGRRWPKEALQGGDRKHNAEALMAILQGRGLPAHEDAVALNAGALLFISNRRATLAAGVALARDAIRGGGAEERLRRVIAHYRGGESCNPVQSRSE